MRQQAARVAHHRSVANGQTDGADEWNAYVAERRALSEADTTAADISLRRLLENTQADLEGGGLMRPISKIKHSKATIRRDPAMKQTQVDGPASDDDEKDDDEDAINSDLDDPEDDAAVASDDEGTNGEVMVCLYDKVQRVKNKWKCTLKDGILSTGGKEYVPMFVLQFLSLIQS